MMFSALFRAPAIFIGVLVWFGCGLAQAAVTMTYSQEPGGVRLTCAGGSLRWSGSSLSASDINGGWNSDWLGGAVPNQYVVWSMLSPNYGNLRGSGGVISNAELSTLPPHAIPESAGSFSGASNLAIQFSLNGIFHISVPSGYLEGSPLMASNGFFAGMTLDDFSLVVGRTITQTWSYAGGTESFTIKAVPEAGVAALCLACCPLLLARRRRSC
jgi:hypothetical protein